MQQTAHAEDPTQSEEGKHTASATHFFVDAHNVGTMSFGSFIAVSEGGSEAFCLSVLMIYCRFKQSIL